MSSTISDRYERLKAKQSAIEAKLEIRKQRLDISARTEIGTDRCLTELEIKQILTGILWEYIEGNWKLKRTQNALMNLIHRVTIDMPKKMKQDKKLNGGTEND